MSQKLSSIHANEFVAPSHSEILRRSRLAASALPLGAALLLCAYSPLMNTAAAQAPAAPVASAPATAPIQTGFLYRSLQLAGVEYRYAVFVPHEYQPGVRWPVILALHGSGKNGSDGRRQLEQGLAGPINQYPDRFPVIVVFPQSHVDGMSGWHMGDGEAAMAELDRTMAEFSIDPARVYLTGLSAGGNGAWFLAAKYPERFAALAVVCGYISEAHGGSRYPSIAPAGTQDLDAYVAKRVSGIPTWIFHGAVDPVVQVEESRRMYDALKAIGADVQYTEYPGVGHNAWDWAYEQPPMITWMLQQKKK